MTPTAPTTAPTAARPRPAGPSRVVGAGREAVGPADGAEPPGALEVLRSRPPLPAVVAALLLPGAGLLIPRVGPNLALVDLLVVVSIVAGAAALRAQPVSPAAGGARAALVALSLVAAGTTASLLSAGLQSWALLNMAQSSYAFATFICVYGLLWQHREHLPLFSLGAAGGIVVVVVSLLVGYEPGVRPSGVLYHANYAGHYLVALALCVYAAMPWRRLRVAFVGLALAGVLLTASFGALIMISVATCYLLLGYLRTRPSVVAFGLAALVVVGAVGIAVIRTSIEAGATIGASSTLSSGRLERSGSGRFYIWQQALTAAWQHPLGLGPDGLHNRHVITRFREAHNLYVAFVAERGLLGLVGLLLLGVLLWRHAPAGGVARAAILAFAASNLVRETIHYRHMWLALALVLVVDHAERLDELARQRRRIAGLLLPLRR